MDKKLLSELTVEEFEGILSKYTDKLIWGLKYKTITSTNVGSTTIQEFSYPWDDVNKVWCKAEET